MSASSREDGVYTDPQEVVAEVSVSSIPIAAEIGFVAEHAGTSVGCERVGLSRCWCVTTATVIVVRHGEE
jgi:hypothetical protein